MLILLTIFLLIFTPFAMLVLHLVRPKFSIQGFLVVLAVLASWPMVLLARTADPQVITLLVWKPDTLFSISPSLLIDDISWFFSLALMSVSLSLIITSITHLGQSFRSGQTHIRAEDEIVEGEGFSEQVISSSKPSIIDEYGVTPNWQSWAGILALTSFGLVAVSAGNMLTLMLAWAALDFTELVISLGQVMDSKSRERIILAFTARMAGIGMVLLAGIIPWSQGYSLSFEAISQSTSIYLILAAGLRLGVLPLHIPVSQSLPPRQWLGTVLRLVPAASSYILLVRVANIGVFGSITPYLLGFTALAGLYAAINWVNSRDELTGRPYWLLGTASMVITSTILKHPMASIAWSMASLLSGGLIFSMSTRHKNLIPIALLGVINFSTLPFTPTWLGTALYQYTNAISETIPPLLFYPLFIAYLFIHSLLLAGFIRHILRGIFPAQEKSPVHIEQWVWLLYPLGLAFTAVTHFLIGLWFRPNLNETPFIGWIMGVVTMIISGVIVFLSRRYPQVVYRRDQSGLTSSLNRFFSLEWLYRLFWQLFRLLSRLFSLLSTILEGDGGFLWALVLFALIFVFLQR